MDNAKQWLAIQVGFFCIDPSEIAFSPGRLNKSALFRHALRQSGADVLIYSTYSKSTLFSKLFSIRLVTLAQRLKRSLQLAVKLCQVSAKADLIAVYNCDFLDFLVLFPSLWLTNRRCKLVIQLEDLCGARAENSGWKLPLEQLATRCLMKRAALVFTPSTAILENAPPFAAASAGKVRAFPPALSEDFLASIKHRHEPFTNHRWRLMYAGGYGSEKGTDLLIQAFAALHSDHIELHLYGGPYPAELAVKTGIHVHGVVSPKHLAEAYASADLCINPHQEIRALQHIYPCKNIEILASGALPVMSSYCHAEAMGVPNALIFDGLDQLLDILKGAKKLYFLHQLMIRELALKLRTSHDEEAIKRTVSTEVAQILEPSRE